MMRTVTIGGVALSALLAGAPAAAQVEEDFEWTGAIAAGRSLEIVGVNGGIEAGPASGGIATVTASKEVKRGSDPSEVTIDVIEHAGGVRICAVYPTRDGGRTTCDENGVHGRIGNNQVEVDFTVTVPTGARFVARTVNGGIEARSLQGDVRATTVNGGLSVSGTGTVQAETVNGAIDASIGASAWTGTLALETVNGAISVTLPASAGAHVEAQTVNGGLTSDFPLTVSPGRSWGPRRMEGTIGQGGGTLTLETVNGRIELRRG